jgi:CDP-diacylglycerol--serine O-phosphatidyltransferase
MKVVQNPPPSRRDRPRVRRLRTVAIFPTMLTLGNLLCGFAAIYFCMRGLYSADLDPALKETLNNSKLEDLLPTFISVGGFLIFLGMFFDMMDGRVARMTSGTSNFGGQLDSLADMVTFGLAPALLMIGLVTLEAHSLGVGPPTGRESTVAAAEAASSDDSTVDTLSEMLVSSRGAWMAGAIFAACCALRLARYNVEHSEGDLKHTSFHGLPSPGAAAAVAGLVILNEHVPEVKGWWLVNVLPAVTIASGLLMVSRVRYAHVGNRYLRGRKPLSFVVALVICAGLLIRWPAPTIAALTSLYALSGPVGWCIGLVRGKAGGAVADDEADDSEQDSAHTRSSAQ